MSLADTDVVVLAGGLGTRIAPVLGDVPKLLAPVGDRTYLAYLLDWLSGFGATKVILSLGHLADRVSAYLDANPPPALSVETVIEDAPRGTAGALRLVRPRVASETALILNGDSWVGADLSDFAAAHRASGAPVSLLCVGVDDAGRFGKVETDAQGRIVAFREKRPDAGAGLINAGVYAFSAAGWDLLDAYPGPSLERDVFARLPAATLAATDAGHVPFIDIGTPESLAAAAAIFTTGMPTT